MVVLVKRSVVKVVVKVVVAAREGVRGVKTKRGANIPNTRGVQEYRGKGAKHTASWWYEFVHGPVADRGLVTHHPQHPNRIVPTQIGLDRLELGERFLTAISFGMDEEKTSR